MTAAAAHTIVGAGDPPWLTDWMTRARYGDRGRGPVEYDCWGAVRHFYSRELGIDLPGYDDEYASSIAGPQIQAVIDREVRAWRPVSAPARGDLVIISLLGRRTHCGVALDGGRFLHLLVGCEACVERISSPVWARRVDGIYRHWAM